MTQSSVHSLILKVGTGKLTLSVIADDSQTGGFLTERFEVAYDGIINGFFCSEKNFNLSLKSLFKKAKKVYKKIFSIKTLYVCLPEEFTSVVKRISTLEFSSRQVISYEHLNALKEIAERDFVNNEKYTIKYITVESFTVDDKVFGNKLTSDTVSENYISMKTNIVLLKRRAVLAIENALFNISDFQLKVFTVTDAIASSIKTSSEQEKEYLLIDISENSTAFCYISNDRFCALRNFSLGLNVFVKPLMNKYRLGLEDALKVLTQFNVYSNAGDKKIEVSLENNKLSLKILDIFNCINAGQIKDFFLYTRKAYDEIKTFIPYDIKVIFTGDGMAVSGMDNLLREKLRINDYSKFKLKDSFRSVGIISAEQYVLNNYSKVNNE